MAEKKKRGPGRPTKYNAALGTRICKRVANGETLREIAETPGMPCESTIRLWAVKLPGFSEEYARARELQADAMADEAIAVARRKGNNPIGDRLLVDTLKWAASKLKPRSYSDRVQVEHQGEQKVQVVVTYQDDPPPAE
ncbi:MAG TPA: hypothetical protein PLS95_15070 [Thermoanaerobaculales bacterium]|jgi:hypothetical protein|nr:hypothetical protein [Thermoanaerobaculales bacterium]HRU10687.1 hypothetical protein [Thermoanaerobaculia bacterium]